MKISGCIVTYNNEEIIEKTISSILHSTKEMDFTLYLSDNCSTDSTVQRVKKNFPQVKIIENQHNEGYGAGHNKVLDQLNSQYHCIINPDIRIPKEGGSPLEILLEYLELHPEVAMVTPRIKNEDGTEQHLPKKFPKLKYLLSGRLSFMKGIRQDYTMSDQLIIEPVEIDFCTGCFMMVRTEVFQKLQGFDDRYFMYFEDADLTKEVQEYGKVMFYPDTFVYHLWQRASAKEMKYLMIQISSMFKFFAKWK